MSVYLIIHGEVEIAPGRYAPGVVSSSSHPDRTAAADEWDRMLRCEFYDSRIERPEICDEAPLLTDVLPDHTP